MPSGKIQNTIPSGKIRNDYPSVRTSNFQTGRSGDTITEVKVGNPIGLLLVLTYSAAFIPSLANFGERPNVRILNT